jgi:hypothetical protein
MAQTDLKNQLDPVNSITPAARVNATTNGTGVDLQNSDGALIAFPTGVVTDGTHTPKVQESDDNSTFTDVAAGDQGGTLVALTTSSIQKVDYRGKKRYIRPVVTGSGATTGAVFAATVTRSAARKQPV